MIRLVFSVYSLVLCIDFQYEPTNLQFVLGWGEYEGAEITFSEWRSQKHRYINTMIQYTQEKYISHAPTISVYFPTRFCRLRTKYKGRSSRKYLISWSKLAEICDICSITAAVIRWVFFRMISTNFICCPQQVKGASEICKYFGEIKLFKFVGYKFISTGSWGEVSLQIKCK